MAFKPNENLAGALRASLRLIEAEKPVASPPALPDTNNNQSLGPSPLLEVAADAIDTELDRINENLIAGLPEKITDDSLERLVDLYRAQALRWEMNEQIKKTNTPRKTKKSHVEALDI